MWFHSKKFYGVCMLEDGALYYTLYYSILKSEKVKTIEGSGGGKFQYIMFEFCLISKVDSIIRLNKS